MVAQPNQWPAQDEVSLQKFYGSPGDTSQLVQLSVADLCLKYDGKKVKSITCHKKVARSLGHILEAVCECFPHIAAEYAGCYNDRLMRHGTRPSLHARGAAIDFWPQVHGNRTQWPVVAQMPLEQLLLETDAPDQPDAGIRGQRNEPARLPVILAAVACSFFASMDDPAPQIYRFFFWTAMSVLFASLYLFLVLPNLHDFPMLVLAFAASGLCVGNVSSTRWKSF